MKRNLYLVVSLVVILGLGLVSCKNNETTGDAAENPCAVEVVAETMKPITWLMHKFDDTTGVAGITPQQSLVTPVLALQETRRDLEQLEVPECLMTLQQAGINYMNSAITYLGMFMANVAQENISNTITSSQNLRLVYETERARLLGKELVISPTATPGVTNTTSAPTDTVEAAATVVTVLNNSAEPVNLRSKPTIDAGEVMDTLPAGVSATAIGTNTTRDWYFVNYNGQYLWVLASLVTTSGDLTSLPVIP